LDVDMNAGGGRTRSPVENIIYTNKSRLLEGKYRIYVEQFSLREATDIGFNLQIEIDGVKYDFSHDKKVTKHVFVAEVEYFHKTGFKVTPLIPCSTSNVTKNGCLTGKLHDVTMIMNSPNHWTNSVGNKHLFFILDKARSEIPLRGFFNEFLNAELAEHRKVLELLGGKMMVHPSDEELTGVGFSLTQKHTLHLSVDNKLFEVQI